MPVIWGIAYICNQNILWPDLIDCTTSALRSCNNRWEQKS